ncbi:annetocin receptor-like [Oratosquilla oratoria]|uniref:annetocin receptor-like n=1 Tax=Oratosquilla oratoria TaxID=337810 RepID=UPI003F75DC90
MVRGNSTLLFSATTISNTISNTIPNTIANTGSGFPVFSLTEQQTENEDFFVNSTPSNLNSSFNTSVSLEGLKRDEVLVLWEIATLVVIFVLTIVGNTAVIFVIYLRRRKKLTRMCYFIMSLCVSDLMTAFFNVLPQLAWEITYRFKGGDALCKMIKYLQLLGPYLSSYLLVMTALDRYQAICHPLSNCSWTPRHAKNMILVAWVMSVAFCTPQVFIFSFQEVGNGQWDCWASFAPRWGPKAYVTWYALSVFILPLFFLVFTYTCICRTIWINLRMKQLKNIVDRHQCHSDIEHEQPRRFKSLRRPKILVQLRPNRRQESFVSSHLREPSPETIATSHHSDQGPYEAETSLRETSCCSRLAIDPPCHTRNVQHQYLRNSFSTSSVEDRRVVQHHTTCQQKPRRFFRTRRPAMLPGKGTSASFHNITEANGVMAGAGRLSPSNRRSSSSNPRSHSMRNISRAKIKTIKLTITVILCYVVCSAPFICSQLWSVWDPTAVTSPFYTGATFTILTLLSSLNSVVNPWIFLAFNENLTRILRSVCTCKWRRSRSWPPWKRPATFRSSSSCDRQQRMTIVTTTEGENFALKPFLLRKPSLLSSRISETSQ